MKKEISSPAWEYFDIEWKYESDGTKIRMKKCKFYAKILTAKSIGGTRHLKTHEEKYAEKHLGERINAISTHLDRYLYVDSLLQRICQFA